MTASEQVGLFSQLRDKADRCLGYAARTTDPAAAFVYHRAASRFDAAADRFEDRGRIARVRRALPALAISASL